MKLRSILIVLVAIATLSAVRLAMLVDDLEHLLHPHEDCPICLAYLCEILPDASADLTSPVQLLHYLNENSKHDLNTDPVHLNLLIRGPPSI